MLSESLHPNRIAARSFIFPSRFGFQVGLRLCPLPNSAITGRAGDNGFIQRNGWFGRHCRQTVKLSDFVSHPGITIERTFGYVPEDLNFVIIRRADVLAEDGKICEIAGDVQAPDAERVDCAGKLLFPGFIDGHTHFDLEVGGTITADDFATGSRAALRNVVVI